MRSKLHKELSQDINEWEGGPEIRVAIGSAAKGSGWFKDITRGEKWFSTISPTFEDPVFSKKDMAVKLALLWKWASNV